MTEKLKNNHSEENHQKEIQIPVIQITVERRKTVLDVEGNIVEETRESTETEWLATTIPPKPLSVKESIEANGLTSEASASVGKKRRKRRRRKKKSNLTSP